MPTEDRKTCSKCGVEKPLTDFPRDAKRRDGRRSDCKVCHCATVKAIYHRDPDAARAANNKRQNQSYKADPDKHRKRAAVARAKRAEVHRAYNKAWAAANPEKVKGYKRKYEKANPVKRADHVHKRRARLAGVETDNYTRVEIFNRDNGRCVHCNIELHLEPYGFEIDHIVPISLGGPDTRANVQLACRTCNRKRSKNLTGQVHLPV